MKCHYCENKATRTYRYAGGMWECAGKIWEVCDTCASLAGFEDGNNADRVRRIK